MEVAVSTSRRSSIEDSKVVRWCWEDENNRFPPVRVLFLITTCCFFVGDVGVDAWAAFEHYQAWRGGSEKAFDYFIATVVFIILPSLIINLLSLALYTWGYFVFQREGTRRRWDSKYGELDENLLPHGIKKFRWISTKPQAVRLRQRGRANALSIVTHREGTGIELQQIQPSRQSLSRDLSFSQLPPSYHQSERETAFNQESRSSPTHSEDALIHEGKEEDTPVSDPIVRQESDVIDAPEFYPLDPFTPTEFYLIIIPFHLFQLGFLFRVVRLLYRRRKDKYAFDRYRDVSFLRLMEAFLESAPQLLLHLYIIVEEDIPDQVRKAITGIAVIVSMLSLAFAVADYISASKDVIHYNPPPDKPRKQRLSWTAYFIIILWQLGMVVSRGLAISLFASEFAYYVFVIGGIHYLVMLYWMYRQNSYLLIREEADYDEPGSHLCDNYGLEIVAAAFNLFFLFKLSDENSVLYTTAYYTLFFFENIIMILLWFVSIDYELELWYEEAAPIGVVMGFLLGLGFMLLYYIHYQVREIDGRELQ